MASSNFHSNIVPIRYVDSYDEFIWEDIRVNIASELGEEINDSIRIYDELRSFPATSICQMYLQGLLETHNEEFDDYDVMYEFTICTRGGYYTGFNVDIADESFEFEGNGDCSTLEPNKKNSAKDLILSMIDEEANVKEKDIDDFLKECDQLKDKALRAIDMYTNSIKVIGCFSNGECVYKQVEDK